MRNSIIFFLCTATVISAATFTAGDEFLRLSEGTVLKKKSREDVMFPHEQHYLSGLDCLHCHHRYLNGHNVLAMEELFPGSDAAACASCHKTTRDLVSAYHRMCITCHRNMNKIGTRSGPVMCGLCHLGKRG